MLIFTGCYSYFSVERTSLRFPNTSEKNKIEKRNIALIGFNHYEYFQDYFEVTRKPKNAVVLPGRRYYYPSRFLYRVPVAIKEKYLMRNFGIGMDLSFFPISGYYDESLNYYLMKNYLVMEREFLDKTKQESFYQSSEFYDQYGRFYNRGVDYYILAINYSPFQATDLTGVSTIVGSYFTSLFTLNYLPIVDHQYSNSKFLIYNKYFVLIDEFEIEKRYFVFHSFWEKNGYNCSIKDNTPNAFARKQPECLWLDNILLGMDFAIQSLLDTTELVD